ncbi:aldehyde dehydrogenase family protein [Escherichia coli]
MEIAGRGEAKMLIGGGPAKVSGLEGGFYIQPTIFSGQNKMRVFQEEIWTGARGNHLQGRGGCAGHCQRTPRPPGVPGQEQPRLAHGARHQAGRVWVNCYHAYPAHAAFGGYKKSGIGRETHKMMLGSLPEHQEPAGELLG